MFFFSRRRRLHPLSLCLTPNWLKFEVLYLVPNWRVCLLISWMTSSRAISVSSVQKPSSWCFWIAGINVSCANKASAPNAFPRYVHTCIFMSWNFPHSIRSRPSFRMIRDSTTFPSLRWAPVRIIIMPNLASTWVDHQRPTCARLPLLLQLQSEWKISTHFLLRLDTYVDTEKKTFHGMLQAGKVSLIKKDFVKKIALPGGGIFCAC